MDSSEQSTNYQSGSSSSGVMNLVTGAIQKAVAISKNPTTWFESIKSEQTTIPDIYKNYAAPLTILGGIATYIGMTIVGVTLPFIGTYHFPVVSTLFAEAIKVVSSLAMIYVIALILQKLAPNFGSTPSLEDAFKLAAYASAPVSLVTLLMFIPAAAFLVLFAAIYSIYIFWNGVTPLTGVPQERRLGYVASSVVVIFIAGIVFAWFTAIFTPAPPTPEFQHNLEQSLENLNKMMPR